MQVDSSLTAVQHHCSQQHKGADTPGAASQHEMSLEGLGHSMGIFELLLRGRACSSWDCEGVKSPLYFWSEF